MNSDNGKYLRRMVYVFTVFFILMLALGSFMYIIIANGLRQIVYQRIAVEAEAAADYYTKELVSEMLTLEHLGVLLSDNLEENTEAALNTTKRTIDSIFGSEPRVLVGIINGEGNPVYGGRIAVNEYPGMLMAITGNEGIDYMESGAVLFSSSVKHGDNVHYVIYLICSAGYIKDKHGLEIINNLGNVSLMTHDGVEVLAFDTENDEEMSFYRSKSVKAVFERMIRDNNLESVGVEELKTVRGDMYFYVAQVEGTNLVLAGAVDSDTALGNLTTIPVVIMGIYIALLLLLLVFATIVFMSVLKAREADKLKGEKAVAEAASKAKGLFLANMSHEIRTPINAIIGMNEMILRNTDDGKILKYAGSVKSSANSLLTLVNDVLDFSRLEAGKLTLREAPFHLQTMISDLDVMVKEKALEKGLSYNVMINSEIPNNLIGDMTRLKQVILNLLTNGVKYTMNGFVHLEMDYEKVSDDEIFLTVSVKDTGIGLKQEDIDKIFLAFERFDENRNRTIEGTGLGMSIVKQILDAMDSHLDIKSVYGAGSEFSFKVKLKVEKWEPIGDYNANEEKLPKAERYVPSFYAPDAHILAVDDMEINLRVLAGLLEETGTQVDTATSGKIALELMEKNTYDIILIDHRMPEMDGVELLKRIRYNSENENHSSKCIALTANAIEGVREMYMAAGFDDYLEKPVSANVLEETLLRYLPEEKLRDVNERTAAAHEESPKEEVTVEENSEEVSSELDELAREANLDTSYGIEYAGDEELYIETLRFFRDTIDEKADEIEGLYFQEDIENYTIKVHALKSSARLIGAGELSEKARLLEEAGKSGDIEYIRNNTNDVLYEYRRFKEKLGKI